MKRPIAMRMSQMQYDSIKDKIGIDEYSVTNFNLYPYLVNFDKKGLVNLNKGGTWLAYWNQNPEIHETFNADIFLEACGVEVEKVWKGNELQFKDMYGNWIDCTLKDYEFRLKPKPDYTAEIAELENKIKELKAKML